MGPPGDDSRSCPWEAKRGSLFNHFAVPVLANLEVSNSHRGQSVERKRVRAPSRSMSLLLGTHAEAKQFSHALTQLSMTDQEQDIAVAKVLGWEPCKPRVFLRSAPSHAFMKDGAYYGGINAIPRYGSDLNACHEMEKALTPAQRDVYYQWLCHICKVKGQHTDFSISATAQQRREAFLRTLNLYTD